MQERNFIRLRVLALLRITMYSRQGGCIMTIINVGRIAEDSAVEMCLLCDCEGCIRVADSDHCACCDYKDWFDRKD